MLTPANMLPPTRLGPTMMMYSRQASANEAGTSIAGVASGAYTISSVDSPALILTASGTEVQLVVAAAAKLNAAGVKTNVVSFPCWELYDQQSDDYKESVFPTGVPVMSVEMQSTFGWAKYVVPGPYDVLDWCLVGKRNTELTLRPHHCYPGTPTARTGSTRSASLARAPRSSRTLASPRTRSSTRPPRWPPPLPAAPRTSG